MDITRAQEIIKSPNTIQVLYKGKSIWIQNLDPSQQTAKITSGPQFEDEMIVSVKELEETQDTH